MTRWQTESRSMSKMFFRWASSSTTARFPGEKPSKSRKHWWWKMFQSVFLQPRNRSDFLLSKNLENDYIVLRWLSLFFTNKFYKSKLIYSFRYVAYRSLKLSLNISEKSGTLQTLCKKDLMRWFAVQEKWKIHATHIMLWTTLA